MMKYPDIFLKALAGVFVFTLLLTGCDSLTSTETGSSQVTLQFATQTTSTHTSALAGKAETGESLTVEGTNGILTITDVRFIVEKFKLEEADDVCDELEVGCEEFEAAPSIVDLPLDGGVVFVASDEIPAGVYEAFEFEVKDLDFDDMEDEEGEDDKGNENEEGNDDKADEDEADLHALVNEIRSAYPEWPAEASMVIAGSFTPTGGAEQPFTAFAKAEIEVEMEFETPLEVTESGASEALTVNVVPELWFAQADGSVLDLSAYDFSVTNEPLEFELKMKDGFTSIERDDRDEDKDEDDEEEEKDDEQDEDDDE